jgi:hypothetical protein
VSDEKIAASIPFEADIGGDKRNGSVSFGQKTFCLKTLHQDISSEYITLKNNWSKDTLLNDILLLDIWLKDIWLKDI